MQVTEEIVQQENQNFQLTTVWKNLSFWNASLPSFPEETFAGIVFHAFAELPEIIVNHIFKDLMLLEWHFAPFSRNSIRGLA